MFPSHDRGVWSILEYGGISNKCIRNISRFVYVYVVLFVVPCVVMWSILEYGGIR